MTRLVRITRTVNDVGILIAESEVPKFVTTDAPYYKSLYYYPDDALDYANSHKGSIKGYKGKVYTTEITFDIDSKDLEVSRDNTIRLIQYLEQQGLYNDNAAKIAFSGSKGFHVHINTEHTFYPSQLKELCIYLSKQIKFRYEAGFKIDPTIYNTNRIFRLPNTPHDKSGLFKVEMLSTDLIEFSMEQIKNAAQVPQATYPYESAISKDAVEQVLAHLPKRVAIVQDFAPTTSLNLDKPCIAALQAGDMKDGESNAGLVRLANHYRKAGMSKGECRVKLQEAALNRYVMHPGTNEITLEKLDHEILYPLYSGDGYTFTCNDFMLQDKCGGVCQLKCKPRPTEGRGVFRSSPELIDAKLVIDPTLEAPVAPLKRGSFRDATIDIPPEEKAKLMGFKSLEDTATGFDEFAKDSKRFRVETGIKALDAKIRILPNGLTIINARAGVGKTTLVLNMASNVSSKGQRALVYQIDMAEDEQYTKLSSKELRISPDEVLDLFYTDDPKFDDLKREARIKVSESMKGIMFNYESDLTVDKIEADIIQLIKDGQKPSVIFIDFLQKLRGGSDYHRSTENLLKLKSIISKYKVCIVGLSQIPRNGGDEETPVYTAAAAQGGAIYEQNASICINLWRPLKFAGGDIDMAMAYMVSKNRMGECGEGVLYFNGAVSELRDMSDEEKIEYDISIAAYADLKAAKQGKRGQFR